MVRKITKCRIQNRNCSVTWSDGQSQIWMVDFSKNEPHPLRDKNNPLVWPGGIELWHQNEVLHRMDGPAVQGPDLQQWFIDGKEYTEITFLIITTPWLSEEFLLSLFYRTKDQKEVEAIHQTLVKLFGDSEHYSEIKERVLAALTLSA